MEIVRCRHGHYYNAELYSECPECAKEANEILDSWFFQSALLYGLRQQEKLASGSTGTVYRVEKDGKTYALKVIDCGFNQQKFLRAQKELALMERLIHCRNVVPLIDSDTLLTVPDRVVFLLEQYMTTFEEYYKTHKMTIRDVLQLGIDICTALEDCWSAGIAHLDVQPKNLFVDDSGHFCLGDFSVAVSIADLASERQLRGTLSYMAPEVYMRREYSQASDIYSLGIVLYCLLNHGKIPFMEMGSKELAVMTRLEQRKPVPSLHLGSPLDHLLEKALAVDVRQRFDSFKSMRFALTEALEKTGCQAVACETPKSSKRGFLAGLLKGKNQPNTATAMPSAVVSSMEITDGTLFDSDSFTRPVSLDMSDADFPLQPVGKKHFGEAPLYPTFVNATESVGKSSSSDLYGATAPIVFGSSADFRSQPVGGTLFEPDSLAPTVPMDACMPEEFLDFPSVESCPPSVFSSEPAGGTLFDSDSYANTCAPVPTAPSPRFDSIIPGCCESTQYTASHASAPRMSQVQFSAIAPKEARKEDYSIIQLFMYEQAFRSAVDEAIAMADTAVQEKRSGFQKVRDNTRVKIVLTCPDMPIDDNVQEQVWCGGYLQFDFAICPHETLKKRQILLTAAVYFDDVPATRLMLTIKALASYEEEIEVARHDIITAFVSYASQDRNRVGALVQGMRKARPDMDIFFDIVTLRSGDNWESTLYREILRRDILFLCWSRNAMASEWVEREWRYALETKGIDAIEPIPLEQPDICPPPKELWSKHFNDSLLYIINEGNKTDIVGTTTPFDDIDRTVPIAPVSPVAPANPLDSGIEDCSSAKPANVFRTDTTYASKDVFNPVVGWLVCIKGAFRGAVFQIHSQYNYIGRAKHMDICIPTDSHISAEKAAVLAYDNSEKAFFLAPSSGRTVVRVNGSFVTASVVLKEYDVLTIGETKLLFVPLCGDHFDWNNQ